MSWVLLISRAERSAHQMPTTATATDAIIRPYPTRRLNHGPKVASAKDTMPSAKSPALVDRNAVAFNIGPSERRGPTSFPPRTGLRREPKPPPKSPGKGEESAEPGAGPQAHSGGPAERKGATP